MECRGGGERVWHEPGKEGWPWTVDYPVGCVRNLGRACGCVEQCHSQPQCFETNGGEPQMPGDQLGDGCSEMWLLGRLVVWQKWVHCREFSRWNLPDLRETGNEGHRRQGKVNDHKSGLRSVVENDALLSGNAREEEDEFVCSHLDLRHPIKDVNQITIQV